MLIRRVIDDELGDDADAAPMCLGDELLEVGERPVTWMDVLVIGNVIPIVSQRRRVEGQQPDRVDAEALEIGQLLRHSGEIPDAVVGAVEEGSDVSLIDDGVFVPERVVNH